MSTDKPRIFRPPHDAPSRPDRPQRAESVRPRPVDEWLCPGDIAACYGTDAASKIITWGTMSLWPTPQGRLRLSPSHVALICGNPGGLRCGQHVWVESTTLCNHRCLLRGRAVAGCQAHAPEDRIRDYLTPGGRVDVYRLVPLDGLSQAEQELLSTILLDYFVQRRIDYDLGAAIVSGIRSRLFRLLWQFGDLHTVFCSELIAGVLQRLGRMNRSNPARFHPGRLLRELVAAGVYAFDHSFETRDLVPQETLR